MPPVQTNYSERIAPNTPGTIHGSDRDVDTGICETEAGIGFGLAVSQGSASDQGAILGGASAIVFRGITVKDITLPQDKYLPPNSMGILTRGPIHVAPGEAVAANDPVYFDGTTGVLYKQAGGGRYLIKGARWKTSAGVGGIAIVQISDYKQA